MRKAGKKAARRASTRGGSAAGDDARAPVLDAIRRLAGRSRQQDAALFAGEFYRRLTGEELPLHTVDSWAALANEFLDFARQRTPGSASVRLFNPTQKANGL